MAVTKPNAVSAQLLTTAPATSPARRPRASGLRRWFHVLGPGLISGAADDDPSGIATYSMAGAQLGTSMLWTSLFTWPLMALVQITCARVGMVTGGGLARALKRKFPRWMIVPAGLALLAANTINIGADLVGMADAAVDLTGGNAMVFTVLFGTGIGAATWLFSYARCAAVLKWLAVSLVAYVVTAFITHPHWSAVWRDLFVPRWPHSHEAWSTLVALLGTTISPYLFFWQASEEVEEEKSQGRSTVAARTGATPRELADRQLDVWSGTFFSNLVMFFVILSCAMTLHRAGVTHIDSSRAAAAALRPLAGSLASTLYTVGIIGVGLLAIPTLAASSGYMLAETFAWRQGLNERFAKAKRFYLVTLGSIVGGVALGFFHVNVMQALYWTSVINGVLAPVMLAGLFLVACDKRLMRDLPSSKLAISGVGLTAVLMAGSALAMFLG